MTVSQFRPPNRINVRREVFNVKKRIIVLVITMMFAFSVCAFARMADIVPALSFNGTQAVCSVSYSSDNTTDSISVTMTLLKGNTVVNSWTTNGTGTLYFSHRAYAPKGYQYTLMIDSVVNGIDNAQVSISRSNN